MKSLFIVIQFLLGLQTIFSQVTFDCSSISLSSVDTVVFGRNHDANIGNCLIVINPRNVYKEGFDFSDETIPKWWSKYSSITFNVLGVGFATCGMNEKGLSIGHMGFSEAKYPPKDNRPVIDQIQFITYLLDNCDNTDEVISTAHKIRISDESTTREHYFVCDSKGRTAILEHIEGKLVLYTNETMPYPILSNDNYEKSIKYLRDYQGFGGNKKIPERNFGVEEIMAIGSNYIRDYQNERKKDIISSAFDLLNDIGFNKYPPPDSINVPENYGTQFTTVFDSNNFVVYFITKSNAEIKIINFTHFQSDCPEPFMIMEAETEISGIVDNLFEIYTKEKNYKFIMIA